MVGLLFVFSRVSLGVLKTLKCNTLCFIVAIDYFAYIVILNIIPQK